MLVPKWFKYKPKYVVGTIVTKNVDYTFDVSCNGRDWPFQGIGCAGPHPADLEEGDKVIVAFVDNNPFMPFILQLVEKGDGRTDGDDGDGDDDDQEELAAELWAREYVGVCPTYRAPGINGFIDLGEVSES